MAMATNASTTAYLCPQGHLRTDGPGRCPEHGADLQTATQRCPTCGYAALKPGDCPFCQTPLRAV
jgi:predicted amidophosphoribosyltransferase